jgi:hypothetical protein
MATKKPPPAPPDTAPSGGDPTLGASPNAEKRKTKD